MEKEFVPYEQALALKELGFDEPCFKIFIDNELEDFSNEIKKHIKNSDFENKYVTAPLYQQVFRWFREKYNLDKTIHNWTEQPMDGEIWDKAYQYFIDGEAYHPYFKTEEESELECLKKLIEIVKEK